LPTLRRKEEEAIHHKKAKQQQQHQENKKKETEKKFVGLEGKEKLKCIRPDSPECDGRGDCSVVTRIGSSPSHQTRLKNGETCPILRLLQPSPADEPNSLGGKQENRVIFTLSSPFFRPCSAFLSRLNRKRKEKNADKRTTTHTHTED
jgi:hypothetical protein